MNKIKINRKVLCVPRLPEHAGCHAPLSPTPAVLRRHAAGLPSAPHDVWPACWSVPYTQTSLVSTVQQLYAHYLCLCVISSNSIYGAQTSIRSCSSSRRSCAGSPSVQVCSRSPQHPTTYDCSATSPHAAGTVHISLTCSGFM